MSLADESQPKARYVQPYSPELLEKVDAWLHDGLALPIESTRRRELGPVALDGSNLLPPTELETRIAGFLDPSAELSGADQLEVMNDFWQKLGLDVPTLDSEQRGRLTAAAALNPGKRITPTPLLDITGRLGIARRARSEFPGSIFDEIGEPLFAPWHNWSFAELVRDPDAIVEVEGKRYGMAYSCGTDEMIAGQSNWANTLYKGGRAVVGKDGTVWLFPLIDISAETKPQATTLDTARELYEIAKPSAPPETHIALQIMRQAAGNSSVEWRADLANEAIYELDDNGKPLNLYRVSRVSWDPEIRRILLRYWHPDSDEENFNIRKTLIIT